MLNMIVNGARVSYDSLEEAKDAARESGLAFWRETLTECAENEAMWNEFLNDLWQSGAEDEAERLDRTFPKDAPRQWLLVALTLGGDDPWVAFLAEWEAQGDERILPVVSSPAFAPWLKQVRTKKHDLLVRAFGADAAKWPIDLLQKALKAEGTEAEIAEWKAVVEKRNENVLVERQKCIADRSDPLTGVENANVQSSNGKNGVAQEALSRQQQMAKRIDAWIADVLKLRTGDCDYTTTDMDVKKFILSIRKISVIEWPVFKNGLMKLVQSCAEGDEWSINSEWLDRAQSLPFAVIAGFRDARMAFLAAALASRPGGMDALEMLRKNEISDDDPFKVGITVYPFTKGERLAAGLGLPTNANGTIDKFGSAIKIGRILIGF